MLKVKVGDVIKIGAEAYFLAQTDYHKVSLVGTDSANRWADPHVVKDIFNISPLELSKILDKLNLRSRAVYYERPPDWKIWGFLEAIEEGNINGRSVEEFVQEVGDNCEEA